MSGIVYKWRITDCKFAYLTDIYGGNPFITTQIQNDARISEVVKNLDEETYATKYETLCSIINADPDGRHIQMLDYKYYFNVDDTSCGLLQYAGTYYNGPQGEKGVGILRIQTIYEVGYTIIRFYLTDNTHYDAIIKNGIGGVNGLNGSDGKDGETSNVILELESQRQDLENLREEILVEVTNELNDRLKWSQDTLIDFAEQLSALTNDSGYITYVQNEIFGLEEKMWGYIDKSACTKTEFHTTIAPYSGFMETIAEHVDALSSAVTIYNNRIDIAEGQLKEAMSYYDAVAGQLNEYWRKYDAVNNRLDSVVSEMTGNSSITFSDIFQTSRMVGLMVADKESTDVNGNPIMAAIEAKINDEESSIKIMANKISLLGETVAEKLGSLDLTINGGNSYFGSDGSGWLANHGIEWNRNGDMVIRGQLGVGDVIKELSETDLEFAGGTNANTILNTDGSGWLAGGNIYWDKFGTMTIKKDVRIEGILKVDEIADELGHSIISFGKDNSNAVTVFYPNGQGSLAGGTISWDPDGSMTIAGDLTVGGSIKQEVLDYANETNLLVGGSTTEFRSDGSGYICNGAIEWDVNGNMTIKGNVNIEGDGDEIDDLIAALNVKDISIGGGTTRFFKDGSGYLANSGISWNAAGDLNIYGDLCLSTAFSDPAKGEVGKNIIYLPSSSDSGDPTNPATYVSYELKCHKDSRGKIVILYNPSPFNGRTYYIVCKSFYYDDYDGRVDIDTDYIYTATVGPQESLMCTCFQVASNIYTWKITSRYGQADFRSDTIPFGRYPKCLCTGFVSYRYSEEQEKYIYNIESLLWNGIENKLSIEDPNNNNYGPYGGNVKILFNDVKEYISPARITGIGYIPFITVYNGENDIGEEKAKGYEEPWQGSVTDVSKEYFVVRTGDDDSSNGASFFFALYESKNWAFNLTNTN